MFKNISTSYLEPWLAALPDVGNSDFGPGVTDEPDLGWQEVLFEDGPQGGIDLLLGKVSRGTKDHESISLVFGGLTFGLLATADGLERLSQKLQTLLVAKLPLLASSAWTRHVCCCARVVAARNGTQGDLTT